MKIMGYCYNLVNVIRVGKQGGKNKKTTYVLSNNGE
jgi:hypothetical protein